MKVALDFGLSYRAVEVTSDLPVYYPIICGSGIRYLMFHPIDRAINGLRVYECKEHLPFEASAYGESFSIPKFQ